MIILLNLSIKLPEYIHTHQINNSIKYFFIGKYTITLEDNIF